MNAHLTIDDVDLKRLAEMAGALALVLRPGDVVTLSGALGAGKTEFARALISCIGGGAHQDVSSPTFSMAQSYETARMTITHFDCYRLQSADELEELGMDDALAEGLVLIEWPERIDGLLPEDRLDIRIDDGRDQDVRKFMLKGQGAWSERLDRFIALQAFLSSAGWQDARAVLLQGDASPRRYVRLHKGTDSALLMDAPRQPDGPPIRDGLPYSAIAHLAEDVGAFVAVAQALTDIGLSAPRIIAHELARGFLILEDLGDVVYQGSIPAGADQTALTRAAVDMLVAVRDAPPPDMLPLPGGGQHTLPPFDRGTFSIEISLLMDWFWPAVHGDAAPDGLAESFDRIWDPMFALLQDDVQGWLLRDYHSPNLIWLAERTGIERVGLIDFQDALRGPLAYDLVSLLQDARIDVPATLEDEMLAHYCAACTARDPHFDTASFKTTYAILGAQRNTKILGIFARLSARDGKHGYLAHIPRVSAYLERNLKHPALGELKAWYDIHLPIEKRFIQKGL